MTKSDPIPARLAALKGMTTLDLKAQWRELFGAEPPLYNRKFLESRLAYRIQELGAALWRPSWVSFLARPASPFLPSAWAALSLPYSVPRSRQWRSSPR